MEQRQAIEGADGREMMTCLQNNTWFFLSTGGTKDLTKGIEYLWLTPILGANKSFLFPSLLQTTVWETIQ